MKFDVAQHYLVPKHSKLSDAEKEKLFAQYHISGTELPKISKDDPAIASLHAQGGDVIKIERESKTAGTTSYYRIVA